MKQDNSRRMDGYKLEMLHSARKIALIAAVLILALCLIFGVSRVDGVSMKDTYHNRDLVFYTRINPSVNRGDVVSIHLPSGEYYIKRVIAVGGDTVDLQGGVVYVNGEAETGDYVRGSTLPETGNFAYPYTVPEGDVFVLGDNREESTDSRAFGSVSLNQVEGVIRFSIPCGEKE